MNKEVIAVIVTYNRKALLLKVIDAVINQSYPLKKILIID
ncbi:TPA: glycosyltransferase, partial [Escherichia coli]